ncbi:hypothetical protein G9A89_014622 [Geosiphon pyriformis]|nr:hypothetical protein G9A89_014622 [Geosiphon pyriformis]
MSYLSTSAELRTQSNNKKKVHVESVYSYGLLYKKSKTLGTIDGVVDSLTGPVSGNVLQAGNLKQKMSWGSEVESKDASVKKVSDLENIGNMIYVLKQPLKKPSFNVMSDLLSAKSHGLKKRSFEPVKSFVLNIEIAAISEKNVKIIRSSFISELSLNKTKELVICEKILVNNDVRKLGIYSNQKIIVKKISIDLLRSAQKALIEFDLSEVVSSVVSKWSVLMGKNSVQVALAVKDKQFWVLRNQHRALFYTLPVGTTVYDLSGLLNSYSEKICFIGHNPSSYVHDRCAVICFADETSKLAAIRFKWMVTDQDQVCLAGIYKKKQAFIVHPVSFSGKTWAQVAGGFSFHVAPLVSFGAISSFAAKNSLFASTLPDTYNLYGHLAFLECSLELLANQISGILVKLGSLKLVSLAVASGVSLSKVPVTVVSDLDSDMILDGKYMVYTPSLLVVNDTATTISPSSSKVLTTKVSGLESKIVALEVSVESVLEKLDYLCLSLGLSAAFTSQ